MPEKIQYPEMLIPSQQSTIAFVAVIGWVVICVLIGAYFGGTPDDSNEIEPQSSRGKWLCWTAVGAAIWLLIGAIVPLSGILDFNVLPPPALIFAGCCFAFGVALVVSPVGRRFAALPFWMLIFFQGFRFPLELILHHWYEGGTLPVQMTYEGQNFDIVSGVLGILIGGWTFFRSPPRMAVWLFNLIGIGLLLTVVTIAVLSAPLPIRQYMNDPPVLMPLYFPYSWIVSVAVTGALIGHLVLFRKLLMKPAGNG